VEIKDNGHTKYCYFPDRESASNFVQEMKVSDKVVMRQSNLEDVFVELTGQKVLEE